MASTPTSIKWPPEFRSDGDLETVEDAADIGQALTFQGMTAYTEVLFTEDGSEIRRNAMFEQNDEVVETVAKNAMKQAVRRTLPDVELIGFNFTFNRNDR
jgi:hypothetical protein